MSVDRRIHPRVLVDIQAEVGVDALNVQLMENLSLGGCFIRTPVPEAVGALVTVRFSLPGEAQLRPVRAVGRVAWHRADPMTGGIIGMGVQFVGVEDADLGVLATYITGFA